MIIIIPFTLTEAHVFFLIKCVCVDDFGQKRHSSLGKKNNDRGHSFWEEVAVANQHEGGHKILKIPGV